MNLEMALTKDIVIEKTYYSPMSIEDFIVQQNKYSNAYIKIDSLEGNKVKIKLLVFIYNKKNGVVLEKRSYWFTPTLDEESKNFLEQGYNYIKSLQEFRNAIDC